METKQIQTWTSSSAIMATPQQLAELWMDKTVPRYRDLPKAMRLEWLEHQIVLLYTLLHQSAYDKPISADAALLDEFIMEGGTIANFVQVEFHEAFMKGIRGDYGDFFGITAISLYAFLRAFYNSEKRRDADKLVRAAYEEQERRKYEEAQRLIRIEIEEAKRNGTFVPTLHVGQRQKESKRGQNGK